MLRLTPRVNRFARFDFQLIIFLHLAPVAGFRVCVVLVTEANPVFEFLLAVAENVR
jgi:hypothetical protein